MLTACTDDDGLCRFDKVPKTNSDIAAIQFRDPVSGVCQSFGFPDDCNDPCGRACPEQPAVANPDWAQCFTQCEGLDENTCKTQSGCRAVYAGDKFHECWGVAPSGPVQGGDCSSFGAQECSRHDDCVAQHEAGAPIGTFKACAAEGSVADPGSCVGAVTCNTQQPVCPANTQPGRRNGCWTGYCIPNAQCDSLPACSTLAEMGCIARTDCAPIYEGKNCTCNGTSCTCQSWTFESCDPR